LFSINSVPSKDFNPEALLSKCSFGSHSEERENVETVLSGFKENKARLHVLADDSGILYGFVLLKYASIGLRKHCVVIDFLFTSSEHRKCIFGKLNNLTVSEFLFHYVVASAKEIDSIVPVEFIALCPIVDDLLPMYGEWGFELLDESWMFLKI